MDRYTDKTGVYVDELFDGTAVLYKDHKMVEEFNNVCDAYELMDKMGLEENWE